MKNSIEIAFNEFSRIDQRISSSKCFALESEWWQTLLFLASLKAEYPDSLFALPEPIDNSKIMSEGELKEGLEYSKDFFVVNEETWSWIQRFIGGGPKIRFFVCLNSPFRNSIVSHELEPNIVLSKAVYLNDLEVMMLNKKTSLLSKLKIPSILTICDLYNIVKTETNSNSSLILALDGKVLASNSTEQISLCSSSKIEYEEERTNEQEAKTDSTGIGTPLFSEKHENESTFSEVFAFVENSNGQDSSKKILDTFDYQSFKAKSKTSLLMKKQKLKRLPLKRVKANISKIIETFTEEFKEECLLNSSKCEKMEISSEDTLEEPMEERLFMVQNTKERKRMSENLFEEELKADEDEFI